VFGKVLHKVLLSGAGVAMLIAGAGGTAAAATTTVHPRQIGATAAPKPHWGGTINVAFAEDATTLDPQVCYDSVCWTAMNMLFTRLYDYYKNTNNLYAQAAAAMPTITNGGKTYTITLRQGMKFSNGQEVTAQDVVYSFDRILNPKTQSPVMGFWSDVVGASKGAAGTVAGIKATGKYTLQIDLTAPNRAFIYVLAMPQSSIIPAGSASAANFAKNPIGSGPFTLQSWQPGQAMIFKRNPDYYAYPLPYANEVYFHLDVNQNVSMLDLQKGTIDILGDGIPESQFVSVVNNPANKPLLQERNLESTYFISLNTQMKPFNNKDVRLAVMYALNRQYLLLLMHNQGEIANEMIPPGVSGYKALPTYKQSVAKAKQLLKAAGYPNGFSTTMYSWNTQPWTELDAAIAQQLAAVGIKVQIKAIAENAFFGLASTPKTAPMALNFWIADFPEASDFFNALVSCASAVKGGQNYAFYCNPAVDHDVQLALAAPAGATNPTAIKYYTMADQQLMADMPDVTLSHTTYTQIHSSRLGMFFPNPVWGEIYQYYWLKSGSTTAPPKG